VSLIIDVSNELLFVFGVWSVTYSLIDFGLSEVVISAKVGDLGAKGVGRAIKPGNVDRDNGVDIGKSSPISSKTM
jgi:hypothetical protein